MTYLFINLPIIRGDTVVSISSIFCSWLCEFLQKVVIFVRYTTTRVARTIIIIRVNTTSNGTPNECVALFIRWNCVVFLDWFEVLFSSVSVEFVIRVTVLFVTLLGRRSPVLFCEGCVVSLWLSGNNLYSFGIILSQRKKYIHLLNLLSYFDECWPLKTLNFVVSIWCKLHLSVGLRLGNTWLETHFKAFIRLYL